MTGNLNGGVPSNCESGKIVHKQTFTDDQLFNLCKKYGENARLWRQKFAGFLPEVFRRRLYEKKGFISIFEFAAKLAGMSQKQVRLVLNLERKFYNKPTLHSLLVNGQVSANKLVRIAAIATPENQSELARMTETLSNRAIETFVKDEKRVLQTEKSSEESQNIFELMDSKNENGNVFPGDFKNRDGLWEPLFRGKSLHVQDLTQFSEISSDSSVAFLSSESPSVAASPLEIIKLKLDKDVLKELLALQEKNIDVNELIRQMLNSRREEIARAKEEVCAEQRTAVVNQHAAGMEQCAAARQMNAAVSSHPSRYIPAKIRKIIDVEQGDKCSFPGCANPAEVLHHELPFALTKTHDPNYLKKLCKAHHELQHMINVKFYEYTRSGAKCGYE